jgi:hypothetical protein
MKTMIREMLAKVDSLQSVPPYFLSTLTTEVQVTIPPLSSSSRLWSSPHLLLQTELYFPSEVIVAAGAPATGLYIVSRGIVVKMSPDIAVEKKKILNSSKFKLLQSLTEGDWFGERSLYIDGEIYLLSYQSRSFCEILYLSSTSFKRQCQLHLTKLERISLEKYLHERENHHNGKGNGNGGGGAEDREKSEDSSEDGGNHRHIEIGNGKDGEDDAKVSEGGSEVDRIGALTSKRLQAIAPAAAPAAGGLELTSQQGQGGQGQPEIGRKFLLPPLGDGNDSDSESTYDGPTGPVIVSRKQRRVALQLGASLKLEESNYITVWCHPETKIMMLWRLIVAFAVLFYMFSAPLLLSASFDHNLMTQHLTLFVLCYLSDVTMITNLVMSMFFFPFIKDGILISKTEEIFHHYKASHFVFFDVMALIPYDLLALYCGVHFIPLLRLPRLYLVLQTSRYLHELKGFSETAATGQLVVLVWWLYMLIHWFGCLFVLAGRMSTRLFGYETNWIEADQQSDLYSFDHTDFNHLALYFRSIYWALYVTSSAGYYDILPTNPLETVTATLIMLYGCQMVVGLLGSVSAVVQTIASDRISFQTKLESAQALAERKGLSVEIREKLACYFQYNWERCRGVDESQVPPPPTPLPVLLVPQSLLLRSCPISRCL